MTSYKVLFEVGGFPGLFIVDKSVTFLRRLPKAVDYNSTFIYGPTLANLCFLSLSAHLTYRDETNSFQADS